MRCGVALACVLATTLACPGYAGSPAAAARRDPFRPPRGGTSAGRTPLERCEIGQLRLVALIYDPAELLAVVEDATGLGYIVRLGTRIGPHGGAVRKIERGRLVVHEDRVDAYGDHHAEDVALELEATR